MVSSISCVIDDRYFLIRLKTSYYALGITETGEIVHIGSGPLPSGDASFQKASFTGLSNYDESNFVWDNQARRWEYPTFGDISYHDVALKATLKSADYPGIPITDLRLRYVSHEIISDTSPGLAPPPQPSSSRKARETLCIHLRDISLPFESTLYYRITPEHDIIERWIELTNSGTFDVEIDSLAFGTHHVPNGKYELTRTYGTWASEFTEAVSTLEPGRYIMESNTLQTGHASNPFYLLSEVGKANEYFGPVYFGALAYSGNWNLRFEVFPVGPVRIHGGYEPTDFSLTLGPGQSHVTPAFVLGVSSEGRGGASRRLHGFARDYILPESSESELRPVLYNSWEAVTFDVSYDSQIELVHRAAQIGVELFCVDDGWFGARRSDFAGLGDWWVSPEAFPDGLTPLIDEVKAKGMEFGIWVEPEMVNPDSELYRKHPDWVLNFPGRPRTEGRNQLILDYGRPEVVQYIWESLDALLKTYDISFIKWDMNRNPTEPGSVVGKEIWLRHVEGVYGIIDRLRTSYPKLRFESCSGGGGRVDLGILQRVEQVWPSDQTEAIDRIRIQNGYSLAYPLKAMECWVTEIDHGKRPSTVKLRFDVAMRGALGIGSALDKLSDDEMTEYAKKIAFYKKIRPTVQTGDLYRLSSEKERSIWLIVSSDRRSAVYSAIFTDQLIGLSYAHSVLPGLNLDAKYRVTNDEGSNIGEWSGFQLATIGLPGDARNGGPTRSRTVFLEQI